MRGLPKKNEESGDGFPDLRTKEKRAVTSNPAFVPARRSPGMTPRRRGHERADSISLCVLPGSRHFGLAPLQMAVSSYPSVSSTVCLLPSPGAFSASLSSHVRWCRFCSRAKPLDLWFSPRSIGWWPEFPQMHMDCCDPMLWKA